MGPFTQAAPGAAHCPHGPRWLTTTVAGGRGLSPGTGALRPLLTGPEPSGLCSVLPLPFSQFCY